MKISVQRRALWIAIAAMAALNSVTTNVSGLQQAETNYAVPDAKRRSFDMRPSQGRLMDQLDAVERQFLARAKSCVQ